MPFRHPFPTGVAPTRFLLAGAALALAATTALAQTPAAPSAPSAMTAVTAAKPDPARVIARVNGQPITQGDLDTASDDPALSIPGASPEQKRDVLISYLADLKLGAKAAEAGKIGAGPDFARRLEYLREKLLVDEYLDEKVKAAVTTEAARKLYAETTKEMKPDEEVRARHILVPSEDEAKKAAARIKAGEDFAKVAAELSQDPGSKADGGELGWFTKDRMVKEFADAAFDMKPKDVSAPVKTQFGWHVIQTEEKRTKPIPTFEEMKPQIDQFLTRRAQQDAVMALRKDAKIERLDESGKVIAPVPSVAPGAPSSSAPPPPKP